MQEENDKLQPDTMQPNTVQPEAMQPEVMQPEAMQPEAIQLEAIELEVMQLEAIQPDTMPSQHTSLPEKNFHEKCCDQKSIDFFPLFRAKALPDYKVPQYIIKI